MGRPPPAGQYLAQALPCDSLFTGFRPLDLRVWLPHCSDEQAAAPTFCSLQAVLTLQQSATLRAFSVPVSQQQQESFDVMRLN